MSKTASDRWGLREVTGSGVGRMGESRWMTVDSQIVVDRHRCLCGHPSRCPSGVGCQGLGLVDTRKECFWEEEQRRGSVLKLTNKLGSLEGLPSLSLSTGALANITN